MGVFAELFHVRDARTSVNQERHHADRTSQVIIIPALIAFALYALLSFLILPAIKRYRGRYDQYMPLQSVRNNLASGTLSIRERAAGILTAFVLPRDRLGLARVVRRSQAQDGTDVEDDLYALEEGEEMDDFLDTAEAADQLPDE